MPYIDGDTYSYHETDFDTTAKNDPCPEPDIKKKKSWSAKTIIVSAILLAVFIIVPCFFPPAFHADNHYPNGDDIVRITQTGSKYHYSYCSYLHSSSIKITLEDAVSRGYGACSRCDPDSYISVEEYQQAKDNQNYILNIILAMLASIPTAILSWIIAGLISGIILRFTSWLDDLPDWIFKASAAVTYITVLVQAIREFIIW